jgi:hypothetical protein
LGVPAGNPLPGKINSVTSRTGEAEEAHLRASTGKYIEGDTPTNVLEREHGLGRHPVEAQGPLALGAVTSKRKSTCYYCSTPALLNGCVL